MSLPSFELADRMTEDAQHSRTFSEPLPNIQICPPTPTIEAEPTEPESEKMSVIIPAVDCYLLSLNDFLPQSPVSYGNDSFITRVGIPEQYGHFVPQKYLQESKERRIVHVKGFPAKWDPPKIQQFFNTWFRSLGRVDTVITIHDLTSRATCRWIIVESKEAAARYGRNLDDLKGGIPCTKGALGEDGGFVLTGTIANVPDAEWLRGYICVWTQGPIHWDRVPERPVDTMEVSYLDPIWLATTTLLEPTTTTGASSQALPTRGPTLQEQSNANLTAHMVALSQAHQTQQLATTSSTASSSSQQVPSPQGSHSTTATDPSGSVHTRKSTPVLPALADQLRDLEITSPGTTSPTKAEGSTLVGQPTVAQTWAKIADAASPNKTNVDLHPTAPSNRAPRLVPTGRIPGPSSMQYDTATSESLAEQMRVVFLLNLPNSITLQNVSDAIIEGPICSIRFGTNVDDGTRYVGIIFLYAAHAEQFMQALYNEKQASKPGRFRFIVDVVRGDAFPADDTINAMLEFPHASRRLTLVKKGFFFVIGERVLRRVVEKCVGEEAVQILWLYNGGNATVVFSEVAAAIKFKNEVENKVATGKEPWDGLSVTFSKDPCEVPLRLVTALGTPMENWQ